MTDVEWWKQRRDAQGLLRHVLGLGKVQRTKAGKRRLRLFACGCCRIVWHLLTDPRLQAAVEIAEQFADGKETKEKLQKAFNRVIGLTLGGYNPGDDGVQERTAAHMACSTTSNRASSCAVDMTSLPLPLAGHRINGRNGEEVLCDLLRCTLGNSFRPVMIDPTWQSSTVLAIAKQMYVSHDFTLIPILADALEEAGCESEDVLNHCRSDGPHVRGCWVVDALLGKD